MQRLIGITYFVPLTPIVTRMCNQKAISQESLMSWLTKFTKLVPVLNIDITGICHFGDSYAL